MVIKAIIWCEAARHPVRAGTVYNDPIEVVQDRRKVTTYGAQSVAIIC